MCLPVLLNRFRCIFAVDRRLQHCPAGPTLRVLQPAKKHAQPSQDPAQLLPAASKAAVELAGAGSRPHAASPEQQTHAGSTPRQADVHNDLQSPASGSARPSSEPAQHAVHQEIPGETGANATGKPGANTCKGVTDFRAGVDVSTIPAEPASQQSNQAQQQKRGFPPERPRSPFAAMAGRALIASGTLSGSFSNNAEQPGGLKGLSSSGNLRSMDSLLSSDSRPGGLQQADCRDTSSSEEEPDTECRNGQQTGQVSQIHAHNCICVS